MKSVATKTKSNKKYPNKKLRIGPTHQLFLAIVLFVIATAASRGTDMPSWEISLFQVIYGLPGFLQPFFFVVTQSGSIHFAGVLVIIYLLKKRYHVATKLLLAGMLAYLATGIAKDMWGRLRPHELLADVVTLDYVVRGPGYPSGHVALAAALALTVGRYLPKKHHWVVPVWIIGVGFSRIYLGVHAPLDVIGGFAIGWASYALLCHLRIYNLFNGHKKS